MNSKEIQTKYKNHVLLAGKMSGEIKALRGNVVVVVFFINDTINSWDEKSKASYKKKHESAMNYLRKAARKNHVPLTLRSAFGELNLPLGCTNKNCQSWITAAMKTYNQSNLANYQAYYKKYYHCDEAPVIFAFNRNFRSYASVATEYSMNYNEFSAVSKDYSEGTIIHELLHQFGASDLYYPKAVYKLAKRHFPLSFMVANPGAVIDPLTAYIIGWTDEIGKVPEMILEKTKHITRQDIVNELNRIWGNS